jgi:hypothetical protein
MVLNVGVRHKNTTLPTFFTVSKTKADRIQFGLNVGVRRRKSTLRHYFTVPNTDRTQNSTHPTNECFTLKSVRKKPRELQVRLNKKIFPQKRKLLRENVFRPHSNGQNNGRVQDSNGQFR